MPAHPVPVWVERCHFVVSVACVVLGLWDLLHAVFWSSWSPTNVAILLAAQSYAVLLQCGTALSTLCRPGSVAFRELRCVAPRSKHSDDGPGGPGILERGCMLQGPIVLAIYHQFLYVGPVQPPIDHMALSLCHVAASWGLCGLQAFSYVPFLRAPAFAAQRHAD